MKLSTMLGAATRQVIRRCERIRLSRMERATSCSPTRWRSDADDYRPRVTYIDPSTLRRRYAVAHGGKYCPPRFRLQHHRSAACVWWRTDAASCRCYS